MNSVTIPQYASFCGLWSGPNCSGRNCARLTGSSATDERRSRCAQAQTSGQATVKPELGKDTRHFLALAYKPDMHSSEQT